MISEPPIRVGVKAFRRQPKSEIPHPKLSGQIEILFLYERLHFYITFFLFF